MALVAVLPPSCVVTVMVAVPAATAVTRPAVLTVATAVLLLLHVTFLLVALAGATVAVNCCVEPIFTVAVVGLTVTPVTTTGVTVMALVAVLLPSCVVTVIVAVPTATAVTKPAVLTVATEALLLLHVTFVLVALAGATVAVNWVVEPITMDADVGLTVTPVTGIVTTLRTST